MEPVFSRFATLDTLLDEGAKVVYGKHQLDVEDSITIREVLKSMTETFPELYNAEWKLDLANIILYIHVKPIETIETLRRKERSTSMDANDSMMPIPRKFIEAEDGVCRDAQHDIIVLGSIPAIEDEGRIDEFYCPTCNKFWREA